MTVTSSTNVSICPEILFCFTFTSTATAFSAFTATYTVLLLPLSILILHMGLQRWRHQQTMTHSDIFTYHMVTMELIAVGGSMCFSYGIISCGSVLVRVGLYLFSLTIPGQTYFHTLTCVERYLAVVQPITYMKLKQRGGVTIRDASIGCVWLMCMGWILASHLYYPNLPDILYLISFACSLIAVSFCSLSILRVLIGLGFGKVGRNGEQIDQMKLKAFNTVMAILGVLLLRCCVLLATNVMLELDLVKGENGCLMMPLGLWFCLPSSLVLPLLFLQKAGKLSCSGHNQ